MTWRQRIHARAQERCHGVHGDARYDPGKLSHRLVYWLPAALKPWLWAR